MERKLPLVGNKRERGCGRRGTWRAIRRRNRMRQAVAQFISGNKNCAHLGEIFVAPGMVGMYMCIDNESDGLV